MLKIECPYCQVYVEEQDLTYAGEALITRPNNPDEVSDTIWGDYVFMRKNIKGFILEQWSHSFGCRKYFIVERSTINNQIKGVWKMVDKGIIGPQND